MPSLGESLRTFHQRHEQLKNFVHTSMRYPLPPAGRYFMGFVYFLIPVVGGYGVMQWAIGKAHASIGANGEHLPVKEIQGVGDKLEARKIGGADGWGGGVNLAVSDRETQQKSKEKLNKYLMQLKKRHGQEQKQASEDQR